MMPPFQTKTWFRVLLLAQLLSLSITQTSPPRSPTLDDIPPEFRADSSTRFEHKICIARILNYTANTPVSQIPYDKIFANSSSHERLDSQTNMAIRVPACELICSNPSGYRPFRDWYTDRGPRIMTWIVPVALLLSSIELSPLDKRRFYAIFHALGDPIDVLWAFLHKLRARTRIHALTHAHPFFADLDRRTNQDAVIAAVVLSAFEDLLSPRVASYDTFRHLLDIFWIPAHGQAPEAAAAAEARRLWRDAALDLADGRSDERLRTLLAAGLYVLQILSAFTSDIGGGPTNPPGGVIAAALTLTFLIPAVLFSAWIGAPTSRRGTVRAVRALVEGVDRIRFERGVARPPVPRFLELRAWLEEAGVPLVWHDVVGRLGEAPARTYEAVDWSRTIYAEHHLHGAKDTYRPWKMYALDQDPLPLGRWKAGIFRREAWWEVFVASLSVFAGVGGGFLILFFSSEGGYSCRHVLLLCILGAWLASAGLTSASYPYLARKWHSRFCLWKGLVLGIGVLMLVAVTGAGVFNSCSCWGRQLVRGDDAVVFLSINDRNWDNLSARFPAMVAGVLTFQFGFSVWVLCANRRGVRVLRWSETRRQTAWSNLDSELPPQGWRGHSRQLWMATKAFSRKLGDKAHGKLSDVKDFAEIAMAMNALGPGVSPKTSKEF